MSSINVKLAKEFAGSDFRLDVDFSIPARKITVVFGPSGSGKSTILRLLAGLERIAEGRIIHDGKAWFDSGQGINLSPQERPVGFLFQDLALFPHMTVRENVAYGLERGKVEGRVDELLAMTELAGLEMRYPDELSGGQKQRLAFIRALAREPKLLLLDEPFSALDSTVKKRLYDEIITLQNRLSFTAVIVTHDIAEAYRLAEHSVVLKEGRVTREGSPEEVFLGKTLSTRIQIPAKVIAMESDEIHTLLTVEEGRRTFRVFVDNDEAGNIAVGDEVVVAAKASEALVFKV